MGVTVCRYSLNGVLILEKTRGDGVLVMVMVGTVGLEVSVFGDGASNEFWAGS